MNSIKPFQASAINALSLILIGGYGYLQSESPSITALIPVITGFILILLNNGIKVENKVIAHIAVLLTFIMIFGLIMPLLGSIKRSDTGAITRVVIMLGTTILALITFIKSFINARKNKAS
tara:strand:+ start:1140 stop:1502 length:363 start_codon:yes stop_codon:yes gene_type:complete